MFLTEYDEKKTMELFKAEWFEDGFESGRKEGIETGRREGLESGRREGLETGQREVADMMAWLKAQNRIDDIMRSISDEAFRYQMIREYKAAADK